MCEKIFFKLIFGESRLNYAHAMKLYVFSRFENSITLARNNIFHSKKTPGNCHSPLYNNKKVKIDLGYFVMQCFAHKKVLAYTIKENQYI